MFESNTWTEIGEKGKTRAKGYFICDKTYCKRTIKNSKKIESNDFEEMKFSDVEITEFPILNENKIILGSDYAPTFIHELVHAIAYYLSKDIKLFNIYDPDYEEFIAEYSALIICKIYDIRINPQYSIYYINMYVKDIENGIPEHIINKIEIIYEFVKKCKETMSARN